MPPTRVKILIRQDQPCSPCPPFPHRVTEEVHNLPLEGFLQLHELAVVAALDLIVEQGGVVLLVGVKLGQFQKPEKGKPCQVPVPSATMFVGRTIHTCGLSVPAQQRILRRRASLSRPCRLGCSSDNNNKKR